MHFVWMSFRGRVISAVAGPFSQSAVARTHVIILHIIRARYSKHTISGTFDRFAPSQTLRSIVALLKRF